jgi:hypothetical protein
VAGSLLRQLPAATVDIFDKQAVPFGLIRFGVAPDHPEVKNCIHQFEQLVEKSDGRLNLFCNVAIGSDLTVDELRADYHAVVLAYGAERERRLGVFGTQRTPIGLIVSNRRRARRVGRQLHFGTRFCRLVQRLAAGPSSSHRL